MSELSGKNTELTSQMSELSGKNSELTSQLTDLSGKNTDLNIELTAKNAELSEKNAELSEKNTGLLEENKELINKSAELTGKVAELTIKFDALINEKGEIILINKKYTDEIEQLKQQFKELEETKNKEIEELNKKRELCKQKIINESEEIKKGIKEFSDQFKKYITLHSGQKVQLTTLVSKHLAEKKTLEDAMDALKEQEQLRLQQLHDAESQISDFTEKVAVRDTEIQKLNNNISEIKNELIAVSPEQLQQVIEEASKQTCIKTILDNKEKIVSDIDHYTTSWIEWSKNTDYNINEQKEKLRLELQTILTILDEIRNIDSASCIEKLDLPLNKKYALLNKLNSDISEIKSKLIHSFNQQIIELLTKKERLEQETQQDRKEKQQQLEKANSEIKSLRLQLTECKDLLDKNKNIQVITTVDYNNCYQTIVQFKNLYEKYNNYKSIISKLHGVIDSDAFTKFNQNLKDVSINKLHKAEDIMANVDTILQLNQYIDNASVKNIEQLKKQNRLQTIPKDICSKMIDILGVWNTSEIQQQFAEQQFVLMNLHEDMAGAVRVYVKIKPNSNNENVITIKDKKLQVTCDSNTSEFGEFYGVFDQEFSNKDMYTGMKGSGDITDIKIDTDLIPETETNSPGLYHSFKQLEQGYSVVIFGYGLSGSGKTYSLLGEKTDNSNVPGLIHYGLANLKDVKHIKLKYLFEQYIHNFKSTLNNLNGNIINLINEIPGLRKDSIDESREFGDYLRNDDKGQYIQTTDIKNEDISTLNNILTEYRTQRSRVKKTPNNPVSSRSHLFMVFEITFASGNTGYLTLVDTAGRESPNDIYKMFIDLEGKGDLEQKNLFTTILGPTGGPGLVAQNLKTEYQGIYKPEDIYNILREGIYINETINHLIYFFNQKNFKETPIRMQGSLNKYKNDNYYVDPRTEEHGVQSIKGNNCLMIPTLQFLDNLTNKTQDSDDFKPTKFITLVCVRGESRYCPQLLKSLDFADKIKST